MTSNELVRSVFIWLFFKYIVRKNTNHRIKKRYITLDKLVYIANKLFFLLI